MLFYIVYILSRFFHVFQFDLNRLNGYDFAWLDEGKYKTKPGTNNLFVPPKGQRNTSLICNFLYTTLNRSLRDSRKRRANFDADLVMLDYDQLSMWQDLSQMTQYTLVFLINKADDGNVRMPIILAV